MLKFLALSSFPILFLIFFLAPFVPPLLYPPFSSSSSSIALPRNVCSVFHLTQVPFSGGNTEARPAGLCVVEPGANLTSLLSSLSFLPLTASGLSRALE